VGKAIFVGSKGTISKFSLENRVAVVTGGGSGIGKGISLGLAGAGANIVVANRSQDKGRLLAEEIRA